MKKGIIIAGFAGIGKTTLAKKYSNVIDIESSPYKYDYSNVDKSEYEKIKGQNNRKLNVDFPKNYIKAIQDAQTKYDIVLVLLHPDILTEYDKNGIDYMLCYPTINMFNNYQNNLIKRGNDKKFVDKLVEIYPKRYQQFKSINCKQIELDDEMLEDALIRLGYNLIQQTYEK